MAVPRGFKRGSGGFLQPIGSVPSGAKSGPGHGLAPIGEGETYGPGEYRPKALKVAEAKVLASFEKAQKRHEGVMSGIAKAESDKFEKINAALNASKESDPKDKLGNTVPSKQTQYLEAQLLNILGQASQRGKVPTPAEAGIQPEQLDPRTGKLPIQPTDTDVTAGEERGGGVPGAPVPGAAGTGGLENAKPGDTVTGPEGKQFKFVGMQTGPDGRTLAVVKDPTTGKQSAGVPGVDIFAVGETPYKGRGEVPSLKSFFKEQAGLQKLFDEPTP